MALNNEEREKKRIDVLLAEYQACHVNRNHYDSVRWTIGSIFIAASLTLLGISFIQEVRNNFWEVLLIAIFSFLMISIWHAYNQHVNPYVMASIRRCHQIESELRGRKFDVRLHESIFNETKGQIRGVWITYSLLVGMVWAWIFRIAFFFPEAGACFLVITGLACLSSALIIYGLHMRLLNVKKWRNNFQDSSRRRNETS